jgi:hypothetical protein
MQFLIIGQDGDDPDAASRRAAARPKHLTEGDRLRDAGHLWFAAALVDDDGKMNGSMYLVDFADRSELEDWLRTEPYVVGDVWRHIDIRNASVRNPEQFSQSEDFYQGRTSR